MGFWFSSDKFGEVTAIQKVQYFQNYNGVLYGAAVLNDMTGNQKYGNLTNMSELYPFLE